MTAYPLFFTLVYSFTDYNLLRSLKKGSHFIALQNYTKLLSDPYFQQSILNTVKFTILAVIFEMFIGLVMALFVNSLKRGQKTMRTLLLLPLSLIHISDAGAAVSDRDPGITDGDERTVGTGWEPEREIFLQVDRLAPGFQPAGGPQVDHAGADPWHGGTGGLVWRGGDPRPVPLIPAVAGLSAIGTLLDEDEDAEEKRRRMEAKIAAENLGAVIGFAAGAALAMKEKRDEHAAREEQKKQQYEQTMEGF